jgi:multidrug efflux pump subunit AcrA (membrane-fusion protein)
VSQTTSNDAPDLTGDQPGTLEATLASTEREVEAALRTATATVRDLKRALAAARTGQVRDLRKALAAARVTAAGLADGSRVLDDGFEFDEQNYLSSGAYVKELLAAAEAQGLAIVEDDDRLLCYPSLLRVLPTDAAVEVDKVRDRRLRPSVLVAALAQAQERGPRFKAETFLDSIRSAYELLAGGADKRADAVIKLVEIWSALTMLPGQRGQYSKQEFARDLYLLDQSGVTSTPRSPRELRWAASTGTKGAGTLVTVARNGQQQRYWGVSFTSAPEPA